MGICDIYDWDGKGEMDLFFLGDVMYALGMNTTKKVCVGLGMTDEEGKKFAKFDDVVAKVQEAKNTPNSSQLPRLRRAAQAVRQEQQRHHDVGLAGEPPRNMGDEIPKEDVQKLLGELCDREDEDGMFPYTSFLDRLTGKA